MKKPRNKKRRHIIWLSILGVFVAALIACAIFLYPVLYDPASIFKSAQGHAPATAGGSPLYLGDGGITYEPPPLPEGRVNILLMGIDEEFKTYAADYHTDTMIVLSVDFESGAVDLISLRRDTFALIPGVRGYYKLNAAINVGGGIYAKDHAGFLKVCEAAEWMLGGISVDYFYALQIPALIEIVDLIDGVDYHVDVESAGGLLQPGYQRLNGEQVAAYVRIRKEMISGGEGDINRVRRQKDMLIAIFSKLKDQNMLSLFPSLVSTVNRGVFTNTSLQQTLALLAWSRNLDAKSIGLYSMDGPMHMAMGWGFCFPDQQERVDIIKKVYGVDVPPMADASYASAQWAYRTRFEGPKHMGVADRVYAYAREVWGDTLTQPQQERMDLLAVQYTALADAYRDAYLSPQSYALTVTMRKACTALRKTVEQLAKDCSYPTPLNWTRGSSWTADKDINEVTVDFR